MRVKREWAPLHGWRRSSRQNTIRLAAALERATEHDAARQALGGFLDTIIIIPAR